MNKKTCSECEFIDPVVMDTAMDQLGGARLGCLEIDSLVLEVGAADELDDFTLAKCKIILSEEERFHPAKISFDLLLSKEKIRELAVSLLMDAELRSCAEMLADGLTRQE